MEIEQREQRKTSKRREKKSKVETKEIYILIKRKEEKGE